MNEESIKEESIKKEENEIKDTPEWMKAFSSMILKSAK